MLLIYPLISKTVHVHQGKLAHFELNEQPAFDQPNDFCPIYNFEFFSFVATEPLTSITYLKSIPVYNSPEKHICFVPVLSYFSLRAPPAA